MEQLNIPFEIKKDFIYSLDKKLVSIQNRFIIRINNFFRRLTGKIIANDNNLDSITVKDFQQLKNLFKAFFKEIGKFTVIETNDEIQALTKKKHKYTIVENYEGLIYKAEKIASQKLADFYKFTKAQIDKMPLDKKDKKNISQTIKKSARIFENRHIKVTMQNLGTTTANEKRLALFNKSNIVTGVQFIAVLDKDTTDICRARDGKILKLNDPLLNLSYTPPLHHNCRSLLSPVTIYEKSIRFNSFDDLMDVPEPDFKYKEY